MNKLATIALALTALVAAQTAMASTRVGATAAPASRPGQPDAPFHGEIVRVDAAAGVIVIGRQTSRSARRCSQWSINGRSRRVS